MKRIALAVLVTLVAVSAGVALARPAQAEKREKVVVRERTGPRGHEKRVVVRERAVVHPGFPIHRRPPVVVVRRHPVVVRPHIVYARPIIWAGVLVPRPPRERLIWEDSEVLSRQEGWTDVILDVNGHGGRLYLELDGRAKIDFAEVVFHDDHAQVVDFGGRARQPGIYDLLDFRGGRGVQYVRVVARALSPEARLSVRMER